MERGSTEVNRRDINRVLYANLDRFAQNDSWEWTLAGRPATTVVRVINHEHEGPPEPPLHLPQIRRPARLTWPPDPRLYEWQRSALTAWDNNARRGIVEAVTGSGKTRIGLAAIESHIRKLGAAAVLVPTIALMDQWTDELATWLRIDRSCIGQVYGGRRDSLKPGSVSVYVVNTAVDCMASDVGAARRTGASVLLVADECHRYGAETFRSAIRAGFASTLGLSATPERLGDYGMEEAVIPMLGPIGFRYGYEEALRDKVIADFEVAYIGLSFVPEERKPYEQLTHEITQLQQVLISKYPGLRTGKFFANLQRLVRDREDPAIERYLSIVGQRRRLLMSAGARADFVEWLVRDVRHGRQTFLFHDSISGCEWLADALVEAGIPAAAHHSGKSTEERDAILRAFRWGSLQAITAAKTLDEGIDVPDASVGVIVAGSTVRRQRIQRIGRILRPGPGKKARILVCYVTGARDDPDARRDPDTFHDEMKGLGRLVSFQWPEEATRIRSWMLDGVPIVDASAARTPAAVARIVGAPNTKPQLMPLSEPTRGPQLRSLGIDYEMRDSGPG